MTNGSGGSVSLLTISLEDGVAENMGCGMFVAYQWDIGVAGQGEAQSVVLSLQDIEIMLSFKSLSVQLEDGTADYSGDGLWCTLQGGGSVSLSEEDLKAMWLASEGYSETLLAAE